MRVLTIVALMAALLGVFPTAQPAAAFSEPGANAQLTVVKQIDNQEDTRGDGSALNVCEVELRVARQDGLEVHTFQGAEQQVCLDNPQATTGTTTLGLNVDINKGAAGEAFIVSESTLDGRYLAIFSGDCDFTGRVVVAAGGNKTCFVANTLLNEEGMDGSDALLTVVKQVNNDASVGDTDLDACDVTIEITSLDTGDEVAEFQAEEGFACNQPDVLVGTTQLGLEVDNQSHSTGQPSRFIVSEPFLDSRYVASFGGDCVGGVVAIRRGEHLTCVITNTMVDEGSDPDANALLTVVKELNDEDRELLGDGSEPTVCDFQLRVERMEASAPDWSADFPAARPGDCQNDPAPTTGTTNLAVEVVQGGHTLPESVFRVSELGFNAGYLATFSGDCDLAGQIVLHPGEHRICVVTNIFLNQASMADADALLTVVKRVEHGQSPVGDQPTACDFQIEVRNFNDNDALASFAAESGAACGQSDLIVGTTQLGVNVPNGKATSGETFVVSEPSLFDDYEATFSDGCSANGLVTLKRGEHKTCVITNTFVGDANSAPVANGDEYATDEDTALGIAAVDGVLANDTDVAGDPLSASVDSEPTYGDLTLAGDGSFTYTPDVNFNGVDSFSYTASDGSLVSNVATVTISVNAVDDAPVVSVDRALVEVDEGQVATNSGAVGDADGETVTLSASIGTVVDNGDGTWSWSLATTDGPAESQTVTINESAFELVVANVAPAAPVVGAPATSSEGTPIALSSFVSDPGTADTHTSVWDVLKNGSPFDSGSGAAFTFTPDDDGVYAVTLTVTDNDGGVGSAAATITVENVAPDVILAGGAAVQAGEVVSLDGSFTDPGLDVWTGSVDPGDGSGPHALVLNPDKTFNVAYLYATSGSFTLTVCVSDDDGGVDCEAASITVSGYAIFAGGNDCDDGDALSLSGSSWSVNGDVHSNAGLKVSGSRHAVDGAATYRCDVKFSGSRNTFTEGPTAVSEVRPWPLALDVGNFDCDISVAGKLDLSKNGAWWVGGIASSRELKSMTLCADEITLSGSSVSGTVTLVAGEIKVSGSNHRLTALYHGVLAFATGSGDDAIKVSGSGHQLSGDLVARSGQISLSGSGGAVAGSLLGWTVKLSGSNWTIDAR
ncbi:MAG: Ig-like domain-containing protein [Thermomicrobiales bacterium]